MMTGRGLRLEAASHVRLIIAKCHTPAKAGNRGDRKHNSLYEIPGEPGRGATSRERLWGTWCRILRGCKDEI